MCMLSMLTMTLSNRLQVPVKMVWWLVLGQKHRLNTNLTLITASPIGANASATPLAQMMMQWCMPMIA